jgi:hypothetical protein
LSSADTRTWTLATHPQLKSSNSSTRSSARKTTKSRAMARANPPGFSCASGNRSFQEKKALFPPDIYVRNDLRGDIRMCEVGRANRSPDANNPGDLASTRTPTTPRQKETKKTSYRR